MGGRWVSQSLSWLRKMKRATVEKRTEFTPTRFSGLCTLTGIKCSRLNFPGVSPLSQILEHLPCPKFCVTVYSVVIFLSLPFLVSRTPQVFIPCLCLIPASQLRGVQPVPQSVLNASDDFVKRISLFLPLANVIPIFCLNSASDGLPSLSSASNRRTVGNR